MSVTRCPNCRGLLPPWLAAGDPANARCPNCGHAIDLAAAGAPAPQPVPKTTNVYTTLDAQPGASKSPAFAKTMMMMGSAPPVPGAASPPEAGAQKSASPAKTLMMGPGAASPKQTQRRVPTLPQLGGAPPTPTPIPTFARTEPLPTPAPLPALERTVALQQPRPAPAPAAPAAGSTPQEANETDADISIEIDTPPPAPPSRTSLPSWVVPAGIEDVPTGPVGEPTLVMHLRSRKAKIAAAGLGVLGVGIFAVALLSGGGKSRHTSIEVKSRPAKHEIARAPVELPPEPVAAPPEPVAAPPVAVAPPVAKVARPVAAAKPVAKVERPAPPPEAPGARPVATEEPAARKVVVASAKNLAAASAVHEPRRSGVPALPSEDDQRLAREAYARGNTQLFQGHVDLAINAFKDSLRLDGRNPAAQRGLGLAYVQAGNASQAVVFLKRYLKASPAASDRAQIEKRIEQLSGR